MSKWLVYNGVFVKDEALVLAPNNRAFCYGDGLFESIRMVNGKLCHYDAHFSRLSEGAKLLELEFSTETLKEELLVKAQLLAEKLFIHRGGRVKIQIWRKSGGYYLPENNGIDYLISAEALQDNFYTMNALGLNLYDYQNLSKPVHPFGKFKFLAKELSILARLEAQKMGCDEALIHNGQGDIIEASASNVFLVYDNTSIVTPGLASGCLAGVMRMRIINICLKLGFKVYERVLNDELLLAGSEIFLTNAIHGIQFVGSYKNKRYFKQVSEVLMNALNAQVRQEVQSTELF